MRPVLILIAVIWIVQTLNLLLGYSLNDWFGLEPRRLVGLIGVPAMPFLHGSISHAAANTVPLLALGMIGTFAAPGRIWSATVPIVLLCGIAVWLLARSGTVVGASGLIFGWFGFLLALGALERSLRTLLGAGIVVVLYGGMIWGVLPQMNGRISWEAHLAGAVAGAAVAFIMVRRRRQ